MEQIATPPTFTDLALEGLGSPRAAECFQRCNDLIPFDKEEVAAAAERQGRVRSLGRRGGFREPGMAGDLGEAKKNANAD